MIVWPSTLPQLVNQDGYTYTFGDTTLRSDVDVGLAKVRRRTTRPIDKIAFTQDLTIPQVQALRLFYNTTTNGGVNQFLFPDPVTQAPIAVRFSKPPSITPNGGVNFIATNEVEVMP